MSALFIYQALAQTMFSSGGMHFCQWKRELFSPASDEDNCVSLKLMLPEKRLVFKVLMNSTILYQQTNVATNLDL